MIKFGSHSLSNRLIYAVALCALVYLILTLAIMIPNGFSQANKNHLQLEEKLVLSLSNTAAIAVYVNNVELAQDVISSFLLHEENDAVKLLGYEGAIFESDLQNVDEHELWPHSNRYPLYSPTDGKEIGTLYIHNDHDVLQRKALKQVFSQVLFILIQFAVTLAVIMWVVRQVIGKPLTQLSETLNKIKPGNAQTIPVEKYDQHNEIGVVIHSVNTFIDSSHRALERERELSSQLSEWQNYYRQMAERDTLTGLHNRRGCEKFVQEAAQSHRFMALLLIDLDGFKQVNDHYGHAVGDLILAEIALRYESLLTDLDKVGSAGRMGGDEFVIYLPINSADLKLVSEFAYRVVNLTCQPISYEGSDMVVSASVGIALQETQNLDVELLIKQADDAMYSVKEEAKNGFCFHDSVTDLMFKLNQSK